MIHPNVLLDKAANGTDLPEIFFFKFQRVQHLFPVFSAAELSFGKKIRHDVSDSKTPARPVFCGLSRGSLFGLWLCFHYYMACCCVTAVPGTACWEKPVGVRVRVVIAAVAAAIRPRKISDFIHTTTDMKH
jgi:hypothetical protein